MNQDSDFHTLRKMNPPWGGGQGGEEPLFAILTKNLKTNGLVTPPLFEI
jgi:hypothetical protein